MISTIYHAPLVARNTFGIEATARELIEYDTEADLIDLGPVASREGFIHMGGGSNLLFLDEECRPLLLHSRIGGIAVEADDRATGLVTVAVGAGVVWDDFVAWSVARGLSGVENLSLIPGETGAAAVQNIGAYGTEIKDVVEAVDTVDVLTGSRRRFGVGECGYGYRLSTFKHPDMKRYVVTRVVMRLSRRFTPNLCYGALLGWFERSGIAPTLSTVRRAVIALRCSKLPDPARLGNAGSFFTNPVVESRVAEELLAAHPGMPAYPAPDGRVKLSAGWLIERAGWKGRSLGRAGVYERQALVLVNLGGATGADIQRLAQAVAADVRKMFGVTLQPEVNYIK